MISWVGAENGYVYDMLGDGDAGGGEVSGTECYEVSVALFSEGVTGV